MLFRSLELAGHLEAGTPFYSKYRFRPLRPISEIQGRFTGERGEFVAGVFAQAQLARSWYGVDLESVADKLGQPRARVLTAPDWLGEQGRIKKFGCQYRGMDELSQDITCRGVVMKKYQEGAQKFVELDIWTENPQGQKTTPGQAVVTLPSRNGG